ncbi:CHASE3 domain-containing protein [Dechloromonas sp. XY25]|uniref:histidine kinase n=1 Tax=Dechloromonas hankyongensis TaxID=2908002 RepID=A0ABS9K281_9RHOO|nr:CHASE3 domain-containing protein [Dechloromonas hankyongensis]MCG2577255.1 CHASE3 domain-containing protein [Dechloromonas hankyongensis]
MPTAFLKRHNGHLARKWHHLLLALGGAFVVLLLASSHWQATASLKALGDLRQQAVRVEHLDSLLIQLMDAESAVRAYLLSGNRAHLEPYDKSRATIGTTLEDIHRDLGALSSNDEALADLSGLVAIKLRSLEQAVERGSAGEETRIQGKRYTDRIRERILGLKAGLAAEAQDSFDRSTGHVERTRWVVAIQAGAALALLVALFFVVERQFKLREQLAALLHSENQRLDALVQARTDELSDLASYLTNARESEKARLARELHDELGALLTAAKMESGWIARQLKGAAGAASRERLARLDSLLDSGIALKRRIIDGLRPPLLEELGLINALRILAQEFVEGEGNPELQLELPTEDLLLAPATALAVFRIAQEALTNIRKHAAARTVKLAMRVTEGRLELAIEDDGRGFKTGWERGRHHGLAGMKHRVLMCAGDFSLDSQPGGGTRLRIGIPVPGTAMPASGQAEQGEACRT